MGEWCGWRACLAQKSPSLGFCVRSTTVSVRGAGVLPGAEETAGGERNSESLKLSAPFSILLLLSTFFHPLPGSSISTMRSISCVPGPMMLETTPGLCPDKPHSQAWPRVWSYRSEMFPCGSTFLILELLALKDAPGTPGVPSTSTHQTYPESLWERQSRRPRPPQWSWPSRWAPESFSFP